MFEEIDAVRTGRDRAQYFEPSKDTPWPPIILKSSLIKAGLEFLGLQLIYELGTTHDHLTFQDSRRRAHGEAPLAAPQVQAPR